MERVILLTTHLGECLNNKTYLSLKFDNSFKESIRVQLILNI